MASKRRIVELDSSGEDEPTAIEIGVGDKTRKLSAVSVRSTVFEGEFASWAEFDKAIAAYQHASSQLYCLRTSVSMATRNRDRTLRASKWGTEPVLFDEAMTTCYRKFICRTAGTARPKRRASGQTM